MADNKTAPANDEVAELKAKLAAAEARADEAEGKIEAAELRAEELAEELKAAAAGAPVAEAKKEITLTKAGSHVAIGRGYANGQLIEVDDPVPAGIPVSTEWMAKVKKTKVVEVEDDDAA